MAWLPMESNPEVMNKFLHSLGVPEKWQMVDVYGLDEEVLVEVPQPVIALLLLFPCSTKPEHVKAIEADIAEKGDVIADNLYYMEQKVGNACGTIALIHSVANNLDKIQLAEGHLKKFLDETWGLDPKERGDSLEKADGIITTHKQLAMEGQTQPPDPDDVPIFHFVAFIEKSGTLYELDGRKPFPLTHGTTSGDNLLQDASKVCKEYMARDPEDVHFTILALTASPSEVSA